MKRPIHFPSTLALSCTALLLALAGCSDGVTSCEETRTCESTTGDGDGGEDDSGDGDKETTDAEDSGDGEDTSGGGGESSTGDDEDEEPACEEGSWDHDEDRDTPCKAWSSCEPGEYVSEEGSPRSDRECAECEAGSFSEEENAEECVEWTDCPSGVVTPGSTTSDVECASPAVDVAVGDGFSCVLHEDGGVECWGKNDVGQLGQGHTNHVGLPVPVLVDSQDGLIPLTGVVQLSAGKAFACALRDNGSVWCWGANDAGQLGTGTYEDGDFRAVADEIDDLPNATKVVAGEGHACALLQTTTARCWGVDGTGYQLGGGDDPDLPLVAVVTAEDDLSPMTGITDIAVGADQTCAVIGEASYCWGRDGGMGTGPEVGLNKSSNTPLPLPSFNDQVSSVAGGDKTTCWIADDEQVKCHGTAPIGAAGTSAYGPVEVSLPEASGQERRIERVAVDRYTRCILFGDGQVFCWGENDYGQLGDGSVEDSSELVQVQGLQNIVALDAGYSHACAVDDGGRVYCWGKNENGELGDNTIFQTSTPVLVPNVEDAVALASGYDHTCALSDTGKVNCWGANDEGQLGIGSADAMSGPLQLGLSDMIQISSNESLNYAVKADHTLRVWGTGLNNTVVASTVESVSDPLDIVRVATGGSHACGITEEGALTCWGVNYYGSLGSTVGGGSPSFTAPTVVPDLEDVDDVSCGQGHTCALTEGEVTCWGLNTSGAVSAEDFLYNANHYPVPGLASVTQLSLGQSFSTALTNGTIASWGSNEAGQLGDGTTSSAQIRDLDFVTVAGVTDAVHVAAGRQHACATLADGDVVCWGDNSAGQLGPESASTKEVLPIEVPLSDEVTSMSAGAQHTCALHENGTVSCWGTNQSFQLGRARTTKSAVPREVMWQ